MGDSRNSISFWGGDGDKASIQEPPGLRSSTSVGEDNNKMAPIQGVIKSIRRTYGDEPFSGEEFERTPHAKVVYGLDDFLEEEENCNQSRNHQTRRVRRRRLLWFVFALILVVVIGLGVAIGLSEKNNNDNQQLAASQASANTIQSSFFSGSSSTSMSGSMSTTTSESTNTSMNESTNTSISGSTNTSISGSANSSTSVITSDSPGESTGPSDSPTVIESNEKGEGKSKKGNKGKRKDDDDDIIDDRDIADPSPCDDVIVIGKSCYDRQDKIEVNFNRCLPREGDCKDHVASSNFLNLMTRARVHGFCFSHLHLWFFFYRLPQGLVFTQPMQTRTALFIQVTAIGSGPVVRYHAG